MLPAFFVQIDHIPLNANGKVNRLALPEPEIKADERNEVVLPRTALETFLSEMWQELLGVESAIGIHDTFFALGGDSIKAAIFINRLQDRLGIGLYIVAIFDASTIAELATYLGEHYPETIERFFGSDSLPNLAAVGVRTGAVGIVRGSDPVPTIFFYFLTNTIAITIEALLYLAGHSYD
jgi:acyl carrier protein